MEELSSIYVNSSSILKPRRLANQLQTLHSKNKLINKPNRPYVPEAIGFDPGLKIGANSTNSFSKFLSFTLTSSTRNVPEFELNRFEAVPENAVKNSPVFIALPARVENAVEDSSLSSIVRMENEIFQSSSKVKPSLLTKFAQACKIFLPSSKFNLSPVTLVGSKDFEATPGFVGHSKKKIFKLKPKGNEWSRLLFNVLSLSSDISIFDSKVPKIDLKCVDSLLSSLSVFVLKSGDVVSLSFVNCTLKGGIGIHLRSQTSELRLTFSNCYIGVQELIKPEVAQTSMEIIIEDCTIEGKTLLSLRDCFTRVNFSMKRCRVTGGKAFLDFRRSQISDLRVIDSTFSLCEEILKVDESLGAVVALEGNTFVDCSQDLSVKDVKQLNLVNNTVLRGNFFFCKLVGSPAYVLRNTFIGRKSDILNLSSNSNAANAIISMNAFDMNCQPAISFSLKGASQMKIEGNEFGSKSFPIIGETMDPDGSLVCSGNFFVDRFEVRKKLKSTNCQVSLNKLFKLR